MIWKISHARIQAQLLLKSLFFFVLWWGRRIFCLAAADDPNQHYGKPYHGLLWKKRRRKSVSSVALVYKWTYRGIQRDDVRWRTKLRTECFFGRILTSVFSPICAQVFMNQTSLESENGQHDHPREHALPESALPVRSVAENADGGRAEDLGAELLWPAASGELHMSKGSMCCRIEVIHPSFSLDNVDLFS